LQGSESGAVEDVDVCDGCFCSGGWFMFADHGVGAWDSLLEEVFYAGEGAI
jgi:hypothetical protein